MLVQTKQQVLQLLQQHQAELQGFGVKRCGLFGSFVRDEANAESDVDILVELEPEQISLKNFVGLGDWLEDLFERKVDLVTTESLSPFIGPHILREVEYAPFNT
ncbi:MAG: nucleotidyltransferase family protein [Acidobacteria bacterium]|nr:nucleotidyltransferase family protein [Acidobacteriota bacterium]MBI3426614.1 nucleotidyltransferase family protein [Acidobacteriota bacterium]